MKMIVVAGMPGAGKEEFLSAGRAAGIPFVRMGDLVREFYAASGAEARGIGMGEFAGAERDAHGTDIWARRAVEKKLNALGAKCVLREGVRKCGPVITDNGNQILDCTWEKPVNPAEMEDNITKIVGVVEVGFFTKMKPTAFIAHADGSVEVR